MLEHKSTTNAASQKCFMAHRGIQHKSGAPGRRKRVKRIKATFYGYLLKFNIIDKTDSSRRNVGGKAIIYKHNTVCETLVNISVLNILHFYDQ
jgi:hypothetical protein